MSILRLENVSYRYEDAKKDVLTDVNFTFEPGKIYSIMGKSGSGKTTLLSLISGLDLVTKGTVSYREKSLSEMDRDDYRAKEIGVIFQGYNLLTNATALENIVLSMNISAVKVANQNAFAFQLLSRVGIKEEQAGRKVLKLSGGEQQRVGIARALSHDPDIIIADEPTGNLDFETEKGIMTLFKDLAHKQKKCVIIVTHSKQVATYADEVLMLVSGRLVQKKKGETENVCIKKGSKKI